VVDQVVRLLENGFPEIVLTGIHIGAYGADLDPKTSLVDLVTQLERDTAVQRLRLGSIEPNEISTELIALLERSDVICPHLHIPLQSGDNQVLQRMNRHYGAADFYQLITKIHQRLPEIAFGFDVITGFPGESEEEFANTYRLIESLPVSYLHVFPYSRRPGTPAASMPDQIAGDVVKERAASLRLLSAEKQRKFAETFIGRSVEVVVESSRSKNGLMKGLTRHYLPISFSGADDQAGRAVEVKISRLLDGVLYGEVIYTWIKYLMSFVLSCREIMLAVICI